MSGLYWEHVDNRGFDRAFPEAIARCTARAWSDDTFTGSSGTRTSDFRSLVLATWWAAVQLGPNRENTRNGIATFPAVDGPDVNYSSIERADAANTLLRSLTIFAGTRKLRSGRFRTVDDRAASTEIEAGWLIAVAVIVVAVAVTAAAIAAMVNGQDARDVVDRQLARDAKQQELADNTAKVVAVVALHNEREKQAGHELPLNEAERAALGLLAGTQKAILEQSEPSLPRRNTLGGLLELPVVIAVGALVWLASSSSSKT